MLTGSVKNTYLAILQEELIPATGCTEPIAIAYCAAKLRQVLGAEPELIYAEISGNLIKNAKSVTVPNTNGMKGIEAAIAAGIVAGDPTKELEVIADATEEQRKAMADYLKTVKIEVTCPETPLLLDMRLTGIHGGDKAVVRIANTHTNVVHIEKNGVVQLDKPASQADYATDRSCLNVREILEVAHTVEAEKLRPLVGRQIEYNLKIAEDGLQNPWGATIGQILLREYGDDVKIKAKAYAAAASDARMNGCELPVIILSGSGNQGITSSMPVVQYAKHLGVSEEKMLQAVAVSDLITVHLKSGIGRLSAFCGAVAAGAGAGGGIAYLLDGSYEAVSSTVSNALGMLSGSICDGAKSSCAAKIMSSVEAGIIGYQMYKQNKEFADGEGIVGCDVEKTIQNIGVLAKQGMYETDRVILGIMTQS